MRTAVTLVAVPSAVGAAAAFAVANVVQMCATRRVATRRLVDPGMLVRLASEPLWLAGLGASIAGFALEAVALAVAPIVLVQPLIVSELLFALPLAALLGGGRVGRRDWFGALLVTIGLAAFMLVLQPSDASHEASMRTWLLVVAVVAVVVVCAVALACRLRGIARTSALAMAAGTSLGVLSVFAKATLREFSAHGPRAFGSAAPWALVLAGMVGLVLAQSAFRAGPLAVSLPLIDIGEPLVASLLAVVVFGERVGNLDAAALVALVVGGAMITTGVVVLDKSPLVQAAQASVVPPSDLPLATACPAGAGH